MDLQLNGKTALVTGSTAGIGLAIAQELAAEAEAEFFSKRRASSLLQRLIEAREAPTMAAYLASPLSAATNGAAVKVEGGLLRSIV